MKSDLSHEICLVVLILATAAMAGLGQTTLAAVNIYWTDAGKIQRANLDGTNVEDIITGLSMPRGIALDVADGKMYWCEVGDSPHLVGMVRRANLDGTDAKTLVSGLHVPGGIALDIPC